MSEPDDYDPTDRIFDFAVDDPPMADAPTPGVAVTPEAAAIQVEVEARIARGEDVPQQALEALPDTVTVHYLGEVQTLIEGAKRLRQFAMRINPRTKLEEIHNPILYEKALGRIQSILSAAVKLHKELWDNKAQMDFYRAMVQVIAQESPSTAHRLIDELRKINSPILSAVERVAL